LSDEDTKSGDSLFRENKELTFLQIQEGISVCDRSNGHLILDFNRNARYNVHDSNTLAYRQREGQYSSTRKQQHSGNICVFQAIQITKSMRHIYSLEKASFPQVKKLLF
jgi:hypothetical protein